MKSLIYFLKKEIRIPRPLMYIPAIIIIALMLDLSRLPEDQASAKLILFSIRQYQRYVSPNLKGIVSCKFEPSCSRYGYTSIERYGAFWGTGRTLKRLFRCSPWSKSCGWDPP